MQKEGKVFYHNGFSQKDNYNCTMFELYIKQYTNKKERMKDWIASNFIRNQLMVMACLYTWYLEEKY